MKKQGEPINLSDKKSMENNKELVKKTFEEFQKEGIYIEESKVAQILNKYTITPKTSSVTSNLIKEAEKKYGKFAEILNY